MPPLNIYLIRHGIAVDRHENIDDFERSLTPEGTKKVHDIAHKLHKLGLKFDLLQTSPLIRARQTAEIFAQTFNTSLEISELLAPGDNFKNWLRWLLTWQEQGHTSLGIVGHEPDLSTWAELLVFGDVQGSIVLKKAGIIGITIPEAGLPIGNSLLFLLLPPKLLSNH
ncbi:phosphohistidine phosphatase, SixA [Synechococcus sp. PCC 7502]|uniref:phosphohistidine phosphatase SixA n=1 Tax=Synechococcus sp. PCC 7502 TaxID=1173263 RepID=UPI00029FCA24|nr:phosphohistidine phosphatase SixA [Synechococcus sp. PCC 7502]AFY74803.1 phosphohistidine phosphatase, SixA [Synechococcus sp. PCC 7502]